MTFQAAEQLFYRGCKYDVDDLPLEQLPGDRKPAFSVESTGCWRGYMGFWLVDDGRLWLLALSGRIEIAGGVKGASVADIFPDFDGRVLVEWFSGKLDLPDGEALYMATPYGPLIHERTLRLHVVRGRVAEVEPIQNPPSREAYDAARRAGQRARLLGTRRPAT